MNTIFLRALKEKSPIYRPLALFLLIGDQKTEEGEAWSNRVKGKGFKYTKGLGHVVTVGVGKKRIIVKRPTVSKGLNSSIID